MFEANIKLIEELKEFVRVISSDRNLLDYFCSSKDFVRSRKLPFDKLVLLIVRLCKKTLSVEIEDFFEAACHSQSYSVSAFVQQRLKLKPAFFLLWNKYLCNVWYEINKSSVKRWRQYRVVAVDGSNIALVNKPSLIKHFGGQRNQECFFTVAKSFYYYDVLNELILLPNISPYRRGELPIAYDLIDKTDDDMLLIYDRHFSCYKLMALHMWQEKERKFVIRAKDSLLVIKSFIASGKTSDLVDWPLTNATIAGLKKAGYMVAKNTPLKVRLVRVELKNCIEVLITNLWEEEGHATDEFKDLYFMRWGVETNISLQKNIMQLGSFSGLSVTAVQQDFYATVFLANLHAVILKDAQQTVDTTITNRKYPMKINKNKSFARLKKHLVALFLTQTPAIILQILHDHFKKELIPIRQGRTFKRERKNQQSKSKYKTYTNFKPAY